MVIHSSSSSVIPTQTAAMIRRILPSGRQVVQELPNFHADQTHRPRPGNGIEMYHVVEDHEPSSGWVDTVVVAPECVLVRIPQSISLTNRIVVPEDVDNQGNLGGDLRHMKGSCPLHSTSL